jgi:hypothetical protein
MEECVIVSPADMLNPLEYNPQFTINNKLETFAS